MGWRVGRLWVDWLVVDGLVGGWIGGWMGW